MQIIPLTIVVDVLVESFRVHLSLPCPSQIMSHIQSSLVLFIEYGLALSLVFSRHNLLVLLLLLIKLDQLVLGDRV